MLFLLLLVTPAYAQEEVPPTPPDEDPLTEQMIEIEEQVQVQAENTMAICAALGIVCEEEAAGKLVEALNDLVVIPEVPLPVPEPEKAPEEEPEEAPPTPHEDSDEALVEARDTTAP